MSRQIYRLSSRIPARISAERPSFKRHAIALTAKFPNDPPSKLEKVPNDPSSTKKTAAGTPRRPKKGYVAKLSEDRAKTVHPQIGILLGSDILIVGDPTARPNPAEFREAAASTETGLIPAHRF